MLNSFSRYYNVKSCIHDLNPLCKILATLIFVIMVLFCDCFVVLFSLFIVLLFVIHLSNIPCSYYVKPILGMKYLFLMLIVINLLCGVSFDSILIMIGKIVLIVMYSSGLVLTTSCNEIAFGFASLLKPLLIFGIPVFKISMAIALSLNFIPMLFDTSSQIIKAQKSRGFDYSSGGLKDKILGVKTIFVPMFILSIKKADNIGDMMEVRNFSFNHKCVKGFRFSVNDICMIGCHLVVLVLVLVKEVVV